MDRGQTTPHSRKFADAARGYAELPAEADQRFFHETDEVDRAQMRSTLSGKVAAEIEDWVADELSGAVIGDVSAAVDFVDFNTLLREQLVRRESSWFRRRREDSAGVGDSEPAAHRRRR